jgi:hypothetical protein
MYFSPERCQQRGALDRSRQSERYEKDHRPDGRYGDVSTPPGRFRQATGEIPSVHRRIHELVNVVETLGRPATLERTVK